MTKGKWLGKWELGGLLTTQKWGAGGEGHISDKWGWGGAHSVVEGASCIALHTEPAASPPLACLVVGVESNPALKRVFKNYCKFALGQGRQYKVDGVPHMNAQQFHRLCQDAGFVEPEGGGGGGGLARVMLDGLPACFVAPGWRGDSPHTTTLPPPHTPYTLAHTCTPHTTLAHTCTPHTTLAHTPHLPTHLASPNSTIGPASLLAGCTVHPSITASPLPS